MYKISTNSLGHIRLIAKRWHDNFVFHLMALAIIFLTASSWEYKELAEQERAKAERAERRMRIADQYKRSEAVIFVLPANDIDEYKERLRSIRNAANDEIIHAQASK